MNTTAAAPIRTVDPVESVTPAPITEFVAVYGPAGDREQDVYAGYQPTPRPPDWVLTLA